MTKDKKIGFIGLGAMGNPMAANLARAGYEVLAYDVSPAAVNRLTEAVPSVKACDCVSSLAAASDIIFASLPNGAIVSSTMLGDTGVIPSCRENTIIVDLSSVAPETSKAMYREAARRHVSYMDAPVSGGVAGAAAGTLTLMAGGDQEAYEAVLPVMECIGKNIFYIGEIGSGDAMKIVNNLLLGCNMAALAEALVLGEKCGLKVETMNRILGISSGRSYASEAKLSKFIMEDAYDGGFAIALQRKDLGLALEAARTEEMPLMMTSMASQIYQMAMAEQYSRQDISALVKMWCEHTGTEMK